MQRPTGEVRHVIHPSKKDMPTAFAISSALHLPTASWPWNAAHPLSQHRSALFLRSFGVNVLRSQPTPVLRRKPRA